MRLLFHKWGQITINIHLTHFMPIYTNLAYSNTLLASTLQPLHTRFFIRKYPKRGWASLNRKNHFKHWP